jgi:hypothetical protein
MRRHQRNRVTHRSPRCSWRTPAFCEALELFAWSRTVTEQDLQDFGRIKVIYIVMPIVILLALAVGIALPFIADSADLHRRSRTSAERRPLFGHRNTARPAYRPED